MNRLGAISAAMLDHAEIRRLERERVDQIRIEHQWKAPRRLSTACKKKGGKHSQCFSVNCPCKCHEEVE